MSSPATVTSIDVGVTLRPTEGQSLDLRVGGSWVKEPTIGLERMRLFGLASSETQQIKPPEEAHGENPDGRRGKVRRYHASS